VVSAIQGIEDVERLEQLALRVPEVKTWDELFAPPGKRARRGRRKS
jgi:hypothetical protein